MNITVLGTGGAAKTLAGGLIAAGHSVVFGSRDPSGKTDLPAPVLPVLESTEGAELVISAIIGTAALEALKNYESALAGHVLLDISNAVLPSFDLLYPTGSLAQRIQDALPETRVVKSLNTLNLGTLVNPDGLPAPTHLFLSGDDDDAKSLVSGVLTSLGWPTDQQIDLGGIETAKAQEHYFLLYFGLFRRAMKACNIAVVYAD